MAVPLRIDGAGNLASGPAHGIPKLADLPRGRIRFVRERTDRGARKGACSAAMTRPSSAPHDSLAHFAKASLPHAIWQLANTLPGFLALWAVMAWSRYAGWSHFWTLLLALPAAAL